MAKDTIDIVTLVLTQKELDAFCLSIIAATNISHFEISCRVYGGQPIIVSVGKMGLLDFVKSSDSFKVKVGERPLTKGEVLLSKKTRDMVISPSRDIIRIVDELKSAAGKKKKRVVVNDDDELFRNPFSSTIMGDANHIRILRDYSKPSHEGYRNTIKLSVGNNVVPLRTDTIRLMQNGCSFHGLRSEDPNQHLKDFLKLVDALDLEGESLSETWTRFKDLLQKLHHHGIDLWLQVQIFYDHVNPVTRRTIDQSPDGKLRDRNAKESWKLLENLPLYDNESWNDPRDFAKPVKAIPLPQDVPSTSDRGLIELENQVQCLMEAHLALMQPTQVNKITSSCDICKQNRNPSSPKRVHFINSIVIRNKENEAKEEGNVKTSTTEYKDHEMTVESNEEFEEETKYEIKEEEENSPKHYDTFPTMKELREEGTITSEKDKEKIVFKMPHKMEMFKHIDFTDIKTDRIPHFAIESDDDSSRKTHYSDSLDLGPEYKHDENVSIDIRSLIAMKAKRNKEEVT
nr:MAK10-like protein [Tanacetum cinerariifolium]